MAVFDFFSKRQRRARGEDPDVFVYDRLPGPLRVQIVHVMRDVLPPERESDVYKAIHDVICREAGVFALGESRRKNFYGQSDYFEDFANYFLNVSKPEDALDCIEAFFRMAAFIYKERAHYLSESSLVSAIDEMNTRFREHGIGYEYADGEILRKDSEFLHLDAVKPVLQVLRGKHYAAAQKEFLSGYDHYRHGRHEEAITDALKAFESVLKVICRKRRWAFNDTDTASKLLKVVFDNKLVPDFLQAEMTGVRTTLESGVATIRNKQGGHGAGSQPRAVPRHLVSYALHLTASSILFLCESEAALP